MFNRMMTKWIVALFLIGFVTGPGWGHTKYRYSFSHKPPRRRVFHVHKTEPTESVDRQVIETKPKPKSKPQYRLRSRYGFGHKPPLKRVVIRRNK
jgi:hypothetical protein